MAIYSPPAIEISIPLPPAPFVKPIEFKPGVSKTEQERFNPSPPQKTRRLEEKPLGIGGIRMALRTAIVGKQIIAQCQRVTGFSQGYQVQTGILLDYDSDRSDDHPLQMGKVARRMRASSLWTTASQLWMALNLVERVLTKEIFLHSQMKHVKRTRIAAETHLEKHRRRESVVRIDHLTESFIKTILTHTYAAINQLMLICKYEIFQQGEEYVFVGLNHVEEPDYLSDYDMSNDEFESKEASHSTKAAQMEPENLLTKNVPPLLTDVYRWVKNDYKKLPITNLYYHPELLVSLTEWNLNLVTHLRNHFIDPIAVVGDVNELEERFDNPESPESHELSISGRHRTEYIKQIAEIRRDTLNRLGKFKKVTKAPTGMDSRRFYDMYKTNNDKMDECFKKVAADSAHIFVPDDVWWNMVELAMATVDMAVQVYETCYEVDSHTGEATLMEHKFQALLESEDKAGGQRGKKPWTWKIFTTRSTRKHISDLFEGYNVQKYGTKEKPESEEAAQKALKRDTWPLDSINEWDPSKLNTFSVALDVELNKVRDYPKMISFVRSAHGSIVGKAPLQPLFNYLEQGMTLMRAVKIDIERLLETDAMLISEGHRYDETDHMLTSYDENKDIPSLTLSEGVNAFIRDMVSSPSTNPMGKVSRTLYWYILHLLYSILYMAYILDPVESDEPKWKLRNDPTEQGTIDQFHDTYDSAKVCHELFRDRLDPEQWLDHESEEYEGRMFWDNDKFRSGDADHLRSNMMYLFKWLRKTLITRRVEHRDGAKDID